MKKGSGRKMVQSGAPTQIWYDVLELEAYVRSHTAMYIYILHG